MKTTRAWFTTVLLALLLAACGGGLKGTFEGEGGLTRLTFHGGGKVVQSSPMTSVEVEMEYEVDGDEVRISHPDAPIGALVLTRVDNDTLSGPMGYRYTRRK